MEIKFNVPDGDFCLDCPHQKDFEVVSLEITSCGDSSPQYIREIIATCQLFNESISGTDLSKMNKCYSCLNNAQKKKIKGG
jgi:hypothetical protein